MARLPALDQAKMNKRQKEIYDDIVSGPRGNVRGPLAVWLYRAELADKAQQLGRYCRYDSSLSPRLSELAILTTARIWYAAFEWQAHVPHALAAGIDQAVVDALAADHDPDFSNDDEQLVYEFSRELNLTRGVHVRHAVLHGRIWCGHGDLHFHFSRVRRHVCEGGLGDSSS